MSIFESYERCWKTTTAGPNGSSPSGGSATNSTRPPWKTRLILKFFLSYLGIVLFIFFTFYLFSGTVIRLLTLFLVPENGSGGPRPICMKPRATTRPRKAELLMRSPSCWI